jgi:hypothetical protein
MRANFQGDSTATRRTKHLSYRFVVRADAAFLNFASAIQHAVAALLISQVQADR